MIKVSGVDETMTSILGYYSLKEEKNLFKFMWVTICVRTNKKHIESQILCGL